MKIELLHDYFIDASARGYVLKQRKSGKTKDGQEIMREKKIGYYDNLTAALESFCRRNQTANLAICIHILRIMPIGWRKVTGEAAEAMKKLIEGGGSEWTEELFRNGSGYADPTAYKAMITMEEKIMEVRPYEIWRYTVGGNERIGVVASQFDRTISVMPLFESDFLGSVEVTTLQGPRYAHPIRMNFVPQGKLIEYVQDVPEAAVNDIMNLFHECYSEIIPETDDHAENICDPEMPVQDLRSNIRIPQTCSARLEGERREKEVYKASTRACWTSS